MKLFLLSNALESFGASIIGALVGGGLALLATYLTIKAENKKLLE